MGLYRRKGSRYWWMSSTANRERVFDSTKTASKEIAKKIWKKREGEIALVDEALGRRDRNLARPRQAVVFECSDAQ